MIRVLADREDVQARVVAEREEQGVPILAERIEQPMPVMVQRQERGRDIVPHTFISPLESRTNYGQDVLTLTKSGAVREVDFGTPELVMEGTVNLIHAPMFGSGASGPSNISTTQYVDEHGSTVTRITRTATGGYITVLGSKNTAQYLTGDVLTISLDVRKSNASVPPPPWCFGASQPNRKTDVIDENWQRWWFKATASSNGSSISFSWDSIITAVGEWVEIRNFQMEKKAYATPFVNPNDSDVYWTGAVNNSPSVRPDRYKPIAAKGFFVEEGTTNLVSNPILKDNLAGWEFMAAGGVTSSSSHVVNDVRFKGFNSHQRTATATGSYFGIRPSPRTISGQSVTYSAQALGYANCNYRIKIVFRYEDGSESAHASSPTINPFTTYEYKGTATSTAGKNVTSIDVRIERVGTIVVGDILAMTAAQIEAKAYCTSLAVGDMGVGYSWSGTAHASASVRALTLIKTPSMNVTNGSAYIRYIVDQQSHVNNAYILQRGGYGTAANEFIGLRRYGNSTHLIGRSGTNPDVLVSYDALTSGPVKGYIEYSPTSYRMVINGVQRDATRSRYTPVPEPFGWSIGSWNGGSFSNAIIACVIFFDRILSAEEIAWLDSNSDEEVQLWEYVHRTDVWQEPEAA